MDLRGARAYVGAIHKLHGPEGLKGQLECIKRYIPDFGLAAPCGFGRAPERPGKLLTAAPGENPDYIEEILADHAAAVDVLREVAGN